MTDPENIVGFNPLEQQAGIDPYTQALELVEVFRKIWNLSEDKTPKLIEILRNSILTTVPHAPAPQRKSLQVRIPGIHDTVI